MTYLAALVVVAPLVAIYAWIVRWVDRYEPEPWWVLALCFLWGAVGATLGGGLSTGLAGKRVAVEVNLEIVPRSQHATRVLREGDRVEIVHAIGGG